jgi:Ca2+-binding EF-hand superfamily protein
MGNKFDKEKKSEAGDNYALKNPATLTEKDYKYFSNKTGLSREQIKVIFDKFLKAKSADVRSAKYELNPSEFLKLYAEIRCERIEKLEDISKYVFELFDKDKNGKLSFGKNK